jgi:hypothetical protein
MRVLEILGELVKNKDRIRKGIELYNNGSIGIEQLTQLKTEGKITDAEFTGIIYGSCCYSENL